MVIPKERCTETTARSTIQNKYYHHSLIVKEPLRLLPAEEEIETEAVEEATYEKLYTDEDAINLAKLMAIECGGIPSVTEQACVAWTVLNRTHGDPSAIYDVLTEPNQFAFYEWAPVSQDLLWLAYDVLERFNMEVQGAEDVGRVLPKEYMWYAGDGFHNYFRDNFNGNYNVWDYSIESPYCS